MLLRYYIKWASQRPPSFYSQRERIFYPWLIVYAWLFLSVILLFTWVGDFKWIQWLWLVSFTFLNFHWSKGSLIDSHMDATRLKRSGDIRGKEKLGVLRASGWEAQLERGMVAQHPGYYTSLPPMLLSHLDQICSVRSFLCASHAPSPSIQMTPWYLVPQLLCLGYWYLQWLHDLCPWTLMSASPPASVSSFSP